MNIGFIFYHGLGYNKSYWDRLSPLLKDFSCLFYDAGYYREPQNPEGLISEYPETLWIGVGHSIGFVKLLEKHRTNKINLYGIVALQSFENFLGNDDRLHRIRDSELDNMINAFKKDPLGLLREFIASCNPEIKIAENVENIDELDIDLFLHDFYLLRNKFTIPDNLKHLIIASHGDRVVDSTLIKDNFSSPKYNVVFVDCNRHSLGYDNPESVYKYLMNFINKFND